MFWRAQLVLVALEDQVDLSSQAAQLFQEPLEHQLALEDLCHHILPSDQLVRELLGDHLSHHTLAGPGYQEAPGHLSLALLLAVVVERFLVFLGVLGDQ